jgi:hypothetical protein
MKRAIEASGKKSKIVTDVSKLSRNSEGYIIDE